MLGGPADVVLSDMAANATGHARTDHLKIMALVEAAAEFAREVLAPGGAFLAKVLQGGTEAALLAALKRDFAQVKHVKPAASRADSAELYLLADRLPRRQARLAPDFVEGCVAAAMRREPRLSLSYSNRLSSRTSRALSGRPCASVQTSRLARGARAASPSAAHGFAGGRARCRAPAAR